MWLDNSSWKKKLPRPRLLLRVAGFRCPRRDSPGGELEIRNILRSAHNLIWLPNFELDRCQLSVDIFHVDSNVSHFSSPRIGVFSPSSLFFFSEFIDGKKSASCTARSFNDTWAYCQKFHTSHRAAKLYVRTSSATAHVGMCIYSIWQLAERAKIA